MNENGNFLDFLKYRWKMIRVSDTRFFKFIWIVAISITLITVLISAGVTASSNKKAKKEKKKQEATTEEVVATETDAPVATVTDANSWMLILVNQNNPLPEGFTVPEFTELRNSQRVDSRMYPELQAMFDDARAEGHSPYITSSYRDSTAQQEEMNKKINELLAEGKTEEQARAEAATVVAQPGTSEHETGLAIDVGSDVSEEAQKALWTWLSENAHKYGFIIRYPENKIDITGISNEPWHLRYVGVDAATAMHESGQCLEEYLGVTN